jgi:hypothetical protein
MHLPLGKTIQQSAWQQPFLLHCLLYNYNISAGKSLILEIRKWIISENGFNSMINFELKWRLKRLWIYILKVLHSKRRVENSVLNYLSSHDDGGPFDAKQTKLVKQVQNFYFLRNCRIFMVMKAPVL